MTLADWSDELKGLTGNIPGDAPYGNETQGLTINIQAEACMLPVDIDGYTSIK